MQDRIPDAQPTLRTERLELRPYRAEDAAWVSEQAGDLDVARTTGLPHPMDPDVALTWMQKHIDGAPAKTSFAWAIWQLAGSREPIPVGGVSLRFQSLIGVARLGFWLGRAHWGRGIGSEAAGRAVRYAMEDLEVRRLEADCVATNEASAQLMLRLGFQEEGQLREAFERFDGPQNARLFGLLRREWVRS